MSDNNQLQQRKNTHPVKEKGQYVLAFGVIATMLLVAGFPTFVIFFFGIFAYFLWKTFSSPSRNETREIFEFYLSANDILRDDERQWYGFELQEVINRGERVLQAMHGAPPLVYFTLGALYHKIGDHKSAVNHLAYITENENADESTYVYPSPELRNYVKVLRKIEREPAEAPLTSAAVRALERARRNRGRSLLEESRHLVSEQNRKKREIALDKKKKKAELAEKSAEPEYFPSVTSNGGENRAETINQINASSDQVDADGHQAAEKANGGENTNGREKASGGWLDYRSEDQTQKKDDENPFTNHKPISEVLHDIYDKNIQ